MANPKYIDESLLPDASEDESNKKVTKKAYSFRCDERLLDEMSTYAKLEDTTMPQLLSKLMDEFLSDKVLTNTHLPEYEGQYINIPCNANEDKSYEYELRYVSNNLDVWNSKHGYISTDFRDNKIKSVKHEGIDFVVIPETVHGSMLPDDEIMGIRCHHVNLNDIPSCLYCIYITVGINGTVETELISWITAMNKLKAVGRYDLISYGNKIKKRLNSLHQKWNTESQWYDDRIFTDEIYVSLIRIADEFNTGAIIPADKSIDNIEYAPIVEHLPDNYDLINRLIKENDEYKKTFKRMEEIVERLDDLECRREAWEEVKNNNKISSTEDTQQHSKASDDDDLPESDAD